jgi:hypothetical protein
MQDMQQRPFQKTNNGATFCNIPRCNEQNVEWVTDCIRYMRANNHARIEAKLDAEGAWTEHVADTIADSLKERGNRKLIKLEYYGSETDKKIGPRHWSE